MGEKKTGPGFVHAQSPRTSSVAQSLDGDRLMGSLHVPSIVKLIRREHSRKTRIRDAKDQRRHDQRQAGQQKQHQHRLAECSSSIFPYSLKPLHKPASRNGRPSPYNLRVSDVTAPVIPIEMEMITKAANSTGWNTARCTSLVQPRNWQEMVEMTPPSPVSPPTSPLEKPMAMSGPIPIFIGLNAGRAKP